MKYLIFGGAFDPPHIGHLNKASKVLDILKYYDKVLLMPTYKNMFGKQMTRAGDRHNMLRIAIEDFGDDRLAVFDFEISERIEGSTFDVLTKLVSIDTEVGRNYAAYMIGSDQAKLIHTWARWNELINLLPFVVVRSIDDKIPKFFFEKPHCVVVTKNYLISSTDIRNKVKEQNWKELRGLITKNTLKYIKENKLYVK